MAALATKLQASDCSSAGKLDIFYAIGYIKMGNKYPNGFNLPPPEPTEGPSMYVPCFGYWTTMDRFGRNQVFDTVRPASLFN